MRAPSLPLAYEQFLDVADNAVLFGIHGGVESWRGEKEKNVIRDMGGMECTWPLCLNMSGHKQPQIATLLTTISGLNRAKMNSALFRPVAAATRRTALATRPYASKPPVYSERSSYETQDPEPDYPQLPWVSRQNLPPKQWDDMLLRRNYGDTVRICVLRRRRRD
jgi:hypothetical protein